MSDLVRRYVLHNLGLKLLSAALAVGLWLAVSNDPPAEVAVSVPIEFRSLPENLEISTEEIPQAQVRVRGPSRLVHGMKPSDIHLELDVAGARVGERTFDLSGQQVKHPQALEVVQVVPSQFHLVFDTRLSRRVEVRPRVTGTFASGVRLARVEVEPKTVVIVGPRARVEAVQAAITDPVDASGVMTSQSFSTHVYVADPLVQVVHPTPVHVTVMMEKVPESR